MQGASNMLEAQSVEGVLNFAADAKNGGTWSNSDRSKITQDLRGYGIGIRDARTLARRPSLDHEGFELHDSPVPDAPGRWTDPKWVAEVYLPQCVELVQRATGAPRVVPFAAHALVRDTGDQNAAPAAEFIHFDVTRALGAELLRKAIGEEAAIRVRRFKIINIWRVLTPPPQDVPLALCDQRTALDKDWVFGRTIQEGFPDGAPYITSVYNPGQDWYFFSNLQTDNAIVFKGYDSEDSAPFGCLHGAFKRTDLSEISIPRASVEARVYAIY